MADILIRGMEMPKENDILVFDTWHGGMYARSTANIGTKSYEVLPLPEGHGRLGDLDALAERCDSPNWCVWLNEIQDAPTIIPAEGGTDE